MIEPHYFHLNVLLLAVGTLLIRGLFIFLSSKITISGEVKELFTYIPAAIFPALIIPASFFHQGQVIWLEGKERFFIVLAVGLLSFYLRNTLLVIISGLSLLYLLRYF